MATSLFLLINVVENNLHDADVVKKYLSAINTSLTEGEGVHASSSFERLSPTKVGTILVRVLHNFRRETSVISSALVLLQTILALDTSAAAALKLNPNISNIIINTLRSYQHDEHIVQNCMNLYVNLAASKENQQILATSETITIMVRIIVSYQHNALLISDTLRILKMVARKHKKEVISREVLNIAHFCLCKNRFNISVLNAAMDIILVLCEDNDGQKQLIKLKDGVKTIFHLLRTNINNAEFQLKGMKVLAFIAQSDAGMNVINDIDGAWNWLTLKETFLLENIIPVPYRWKDKSEKNAVHEQEVLWKTMRRYQEGSSSSPCNVKENEKHFGDMLRDLDVLPKNNEGCSDWLRRTHIFSKAIDGKIVWTDNDRGTHKKHRTKKRHKTVLFSFNDTQIGGTSHANLQNSMDCPSVPAINNDKKKKQSAFLENEEAQNWTTQE